MLSWNRFVTSWLLDYHKMDVGMYFFIGKGACTRNCVNGRYTMEMGDVPPPVHANHERIIICNCAYIHLYQGRVGGVPLLIN